MHQRYVGATGLQVSEIGLGTLTWGRDTDEHEAKALLSAFLDAGGTLLDTSASYGDGDSERVLGGLLGSSIARSEVVLATKAGIGRVGGQRRIDVSRGALLRTLDASLARLGTDHVDLWQVHVWSDEVPLEETLTALDLAISSGRASYVGVSNYTGWQAAQAATWQRAVPGRTPIASTQVEYSLLNRRVEAEVVPAARANGLGVLAWAPLARGALTGKYRHGTPADSRAASSHFASYVEPYLDELHRGVVESVATAAEGLGLTPIELAISWLLARPGLTSAIVGPRTLEQLQAVLPATSVALPDAITSVLDDVSLGL